jgi:hypothetical protein
MPLPLRPSVSSRGAYTVPCGRTNIVDIAALSH